MNRDDMLTLMFVFRATDAQGREGLFIEALSRIPETSLSEFAEKVHALVAPDEKVRS